MILLITCVFEEFAPDPLAACLHCMGKDIELAILFADVVGSTRLYEQMGDLRARDMVAICIDVMRSATEQRQGTVIKTMGDEVMATFPSADEALNAAAQMQQQISTHAQLKG